MGMVDVGNKAVSQRIAVATATVHMSEDAFRAVMEGKVSKGDVFAVAEVAGTLAAKRTWEILPFCHQIPLDQVTISFTPINDSCSIEIRAAVKVHAKTGAEMEALTAAAVAALTIHDMCKGIDPSITVTDLMLLYKEGGKSGVYKRG
ncbi:MAG: cyclic pyranopterin monophosphate synthase [Thermotogota bacterium]|nr:cyclic pyranopterin monophosphate synthase [Thermotogota bacterium]MDK2865372.1 cyclic pyranopterin monophosphate synthase [Thermotogota bacterium]